MGKLALDTLSRSDVALDAENTAIEYSSWSKEV